MLLLFPTDRACLRFPCYPSPHQLQDGPSAHRLARTPAPRLCNGEWSGVKPTRGVEESGNALERTIGFLSILGSRSVRHQPYGICQLVGTVDDAVAQVSPLCCAFATSGVTESDIGVRRRARVRTSSGWIINSVDVELILRLVWRRHLLRRWGLVAIRDIERQASVSHRDLEPRSLYRLMATCDDKQAHACLLRLI